mmetsp:Transcript_4439/g.5766  ORF Transcript_4439/g.5766 Transcript_4439/m.5766 type:complete len:343 (-) Transcript_4439:329-1357(-)
MNDISSSNDNSNPQQGTSSTTTPTSPSTPINFQKPEKFKIPPTQRDRRKLFVGGLPPEVTGEEFRNFFAKYGTILDSVVMVDRETKRSRGFGFVTFEDIKVANKILSTRGNNNENEEETCSSSSTVSSAGADAASDSNSKTNKRGNICIRGKLCEVKASEPKKEGLNPSSPYHKTGRGPGSVSGAAFRASMSVGSSPGAAATVATNNYQQQQHYGGYSYGYDNFYDTNHYMQYPQTFSTDYYSNAYNPHHYGSHQDYYGPNVEVMYPQPFYNMDRVTMGTPQHYGNYYVDPNGNTTAFNNNHSPNSNVSQTNISEHPNPLNQGNQISNGIKIDDKNSSSKVE